MNSAGEETTEYLPSMLELDAESLFAVDVQNNPVARTYSGVFHAMKFQVALSALAKQETRHLPAAKQGASLCALLSAVARLHNRMSLHEAEA